MWFGRKTKTFTTAHGEDKGHRCVRCRLKGAALQKFVWVLPSFTLTGGGRFAGGALYMCCCLLWKRWSEDLEGNGVTVITEGWPLGPQLPSLSPSYFSEKIYISFIFSQPRLSSLVFTTSDQESSLVDSSSVMRGKVNHLQNVEYEYQWSPEEWSRILPRPPQTGSPPSSRDQPDAPQRMGISVALPPCGIPHPMKSLHITSPCRTWARFC